MPRLHKRRKKTLKKGPCMLLEVWQRIRPRLIEQMAHHALLISSLLGLACAELVVTWFFHGWVMNTLTGFHVVLALISLWKLHADS
jgi:hypothetical protein